MRLAAYLAVAALALACGGAQHEPDTVEFAEPLAMRVPEVQLDLSGVAASSDPDAMRAAVEAVLADAGFAAGEATTTESGTLVVRAARDGDPPLVVAVRDTPWTEQATDAFVANHYQEPGGAQPARFVFEPDTLPFALRYLFGSDWWGLLESRLYASFAAPGASRAEVDQHVGVCRSVLTEFGYDPATPRTSLQSLLDALPRPERDAEYHPIATLLCVGLLLGEEARAHHPRLQWIPGDEAMARWFALRDRRDADILLRPVDYAVQLYRTPIGNGIRAYVELVDVRLAD